LRAHPSFLNEEEGEIRLSQLSQSTSKTTIHNNIQITTKAWQNIGISSNFKSYLNHKKKEFSHIKVKRNCTAVQTLGTQII
jgi:hypothetical protein